jgi:hypothetical protein
MSPRYGEDARFSLPPDSMTNHIPFDGYVLRRARRYFVAFVPPCLQPRRVRALQGTSLYADSLTELRTFYGSQIVDR